MSNEEVKREVNASAFLHDRIPSHLCGQLPELRDYGIYRKLNNGKEEFVSYCKPEVELYFGFYKDDVNRMIDRYLPKKK